MTLQGVWHSLLVPSWSPFWVQKAKTASTHHIRSRISHSPLPPSPPWVHFHMPLQIDFCTTLAAAAAAEAEAASHYFLICFSRFAFACFFALFVFFFLLLFASFCALHSWNSRRLRAFAFCFLLSLSLSFSSAAQAALRSQLFNCVCVWLVCSSVFNTGARQLGFMCIF